MYTDKGGDMDEKKVALVMRALYRVHNPSFEDVGQPLSQMRALDKYRSDLKLEKMARSVLEDLSEH